MNALKIIYILGSLILCSYWANKAKNKWFVAAILFWLYSLPILEDPRYIISLPFAGIDLQPSRILFLFLSACLFVFIIRARLEGKSLLAYKVSRIQLYEFWLVVFISIMILVMMLNLNELGARTVIVSTIKLLTFLILYLFSRECVSQQDFHILTIAIVTFAGLSALVGIYQFFGDPSFFRLGVSRAAFGSYIRGNGFFTSEYDQGLFLTMALLIGLLTLQNKWSKYLIAALLPVGVFLSMHRASWVILLIVSGILLVKDFRKINVWVFSVAISIIIGLFIFLNLPLRTNYAGSFLDLLVSQRVEDNTLGVRGNLNEFALGMIQKYPLGIGDYSSSLYIQESYNNNIPLVEGNPLVVHNGFLSAGVLYGIAGMIAFTLFMITTLIHYVKRNILATNIGLMIVLTLMCFLIINMTNDLSFFGDRINLFIGFLLGSVLSLNPFIRNTNQVSAKESNERVLQQTNP